LFYNHFCFHQYCPAGGAVETNIEKQRALSSSSDIMTKELPESKIATPFD
jgi:hypothetical protein